jgi:hypothetical protein
MVDSTPLSSSETKGEIMKTMPGFALVLLGFAFSGCDSSLKSARSLRLPQGDAENGKIAFSALNCTECHTVAGVDLPKPTVTPEKVIVLGGEVTRLRNIGDLMTSIIHPNYSFSDKMPAGKRPAKSPMPVVNDKMSVKELIDIITFLQPRYTQIPPPPDWSFTL